LSILSGETNNVDDENIEHETELVYNDRKAYEQLIRDLGDFDEISVDPKSETIYVGARYLRAI
jgi:hypothetical protein